MLFLQINKTHNHQLMELIIWFPRMILIQLHLSSIFHQFTTLTTKFYFKPRVIWFRWWWSKFWWRIIRMYCLLKYLNFKSCSILLAKWLFRYDISLWYTSLHWNNSNSRNIHINTYIPFPSNSNYYAPDSSQ